MESWNALFFQSCTSRVVSVNLETKVVICLLRFAAEANAASSSSSVEFVIVSLIAERPRSFVCGEKR